MEKPKRYRYPTIDILITALVLMGSFLGVELFCRVYYVYEIFPSIDILTHTLSGMAFGVGFYWMLSLTNVRKKKFLAVFFTFLVSIGWEVIEQIEDIVNYNPPYLIDIFFWNGVRDVVSDIIGAILGLGIFFFLKKKTSLLG